MSLQLAAQHLASRGRGPDTTLVHMAPSEVAGLQALAKAHGGSLTVNPDTGLPEAGILSAILPLALGAALGPAGLGMSAAMTGLTVGAVGTLATGSLQKGLMAGLGAFGGAGIGAGLSAAAGAGAAAPLSDAAAATGLPGVGLSDVALGVPEAASAAAPSATQAAATAGMQSIPGVPGLQVTGALPPAPGAIPAAAPMLPATATAMPTVTPPAGQGFFGQMGKGLKALGTEAGREAFLGQAASKGVEATGVGGLGGLAQYGLAAAAPIMQEMQPKYEPYQGSGPNPYQFQFAWERPQGPSYDSRESQQLYGRLTPLKLAGGGETAEKDVAKGMSGASADAFRYLMGRAPVSPVAQSAQRYVANMPAAPITVPAPSTGAPGAPSGSAVQVGSPNYAFDPATGRMTVLPPVAQEPITPQPVYDDSAYWAANGGLATLASGGGVSHLGDYSDGGRLLQGPGDGVSDSIPATIADKRPARLADGEFVVPARIVSELGNGSTNAGARKLYAMMDRIQKARGKTVGKDRVAVNSRADKALPA